MASIRDVARKAGVAISTVSKVLNHYPNVSEETRIKVNEAIRELKFTPNTIASALSSKQAGRVALLVNLNTQTQAIDEIDMQYLSGAINKAQEKGLDVITVFFSMIKDRSVAEIENYLRAQAIEGIIIYGMSREDKVLHKLIEGQQYFIIGKQAMKSGHKENLERLYKELLNKDWFMTLLDLEDYIAVKDKMLEDYRDREKWKKMMLVNIAKAGFFSSDRTIREYNRDIWKLN